MENGCGLVVNRLGLVMNGFIVVENEVCLIRNALCNPGLEFCFAFRFVFLKAITIRLAASQHRLEQAGNSRSQSSLRSV